MDIKSALQSQLGQVSMWLNSGKDKELVKTNAQAILDNVKALVADNKDDAYVSANAEKLESVIKIAQGQVDSI